MAITDSSMPVIEGDKEGAEVRVSDRNKFGEGGIQDKPCIEKQTTISIISIRSKDFV